MALAFAQGASWPGAIAVSGGGDSIALMVLAAEWAKTDGRAPPFVLSVDHGLRPGSSRDAARVAAQAKRLGLKGKVLAWGGRKPTSDVESAARMARYRLLGDWCREHDVKSLYAGHTLEDQAETFLLRLARGSGVDGLAAMSLVCGFPQPGYEPLALVRPLLTVRRERLRRFLLERDMGWLEDPMNADTRFARARLRAAWPALEGLGLTASRVAEAAGHLVRARAALELDTDNFLARASRNRKGGVLLDGAGLAELPDEIALRALARVLMDVSGQIYRPRLARLEALMAALRKDRPARGRTLHGCWIRPAAAQERCFGPRTLRIEPEPARRRKVGNSKDQTVVTKFEC